MSRSSFKDPYRAVARGFTRRGVRYVVVWMAGINYYARSPTETFATLDYDLFVDPTLKNVAAAIRCLKVLGFSLGTADGAFRDEDLRSVIGNRQTLVATTPEGLMVELLLKVSGYPFSELIRDAAHRDGGGVSD